MMRPLEYPKASSVKPLLQRMAEEKRFQMERGSIAGSYFMVQLPDGSMEKRMKMPINVDPGVHSSFNLDQLVPGKCHDLQTIEKLYHDRFVLVSLQCQLCRRCRQYPRLRCRSTRQAQRATATASISRTRRRRRAVAGRTWTTSRCPRSRRGRRASSARLPWYRGTPRSRRLPLTCRDCRRTDRCRSSTEYAKPARARGTSQVSAPSKTRGQRSIPMATLGRACTCDCPLGVSWARATITKLT